MKKRNGSMEKRVVSLMCDKIRNLKVDIDEMAYRAPENLIRFIHDQYEEAQEELNQSGESQS